MTPSSATAYPVDGYDADSSRASTSPPDQSYGRSLSPDSYAPPAKRHRGHDSFDRPRSSAWLPAVNASPESHPTTRLPPIRLAPDHGSPASSSSQYNETYTRTPPPPPTPISSRQHPIVDGGPHQHRSGPAYGADLGDEVVSDVEADGRLTTIEESAETYSPPSTQVSPVADRFVDLPPTGPALAPSPRSEPVGRPSYPTIALDTSYRPIAPTISSTNHDNWSPPRQSATLSSPPSESIRAARDNDADASRNPNARPSDKTFKCNICPKSFTRNYDLTRHRSSHQDARIHVCAQCGRSFNRRDALSRHNLIRGCGQQPRHAPPQEPGSPVGPQSAKLHSRSLLRPTFAVPTARSAEPPYHHRPTGPPPPPYHASSPQLSSPYQHHRPYGCHDGRLPGPTFEAIRT